jgi:hypothetical protein
MAQELEAAVSELGRKSLLCALAGGTLGTCLGLSRRHAPAHTAVTMGVNFAVVGCTFFGLEALLSSGVVGSAAAARLPPGGAGAASSGQGGQGGQRALAPAPPLTDPEHLAPRALTHGVAGAGTGAAVSGFVLGGARRVAMGGGAFGVAGGAGYVGYAYLEEWRRRRGREIVAERRRARVTGGEGGGAPAKQPQPSGVVIGEASAGQLASDAAAAADAVRSAQQLDVGDAAAAAAVAARAAGDGSDFVPLSERTWWPIKKLSEAEYQEKLRTAAAEATFTAREKTELFEQGVIPAEQAVHWQKVAATAREKLADREAVARSATASNDFVPAGTFAGAKDGFEFKHGDRGTGYYKTTCSATAAAAAAGK